MSPSPFGKGFQVSLSDLQDEFGQMLGRLWHTGINTPPLDGHKWAPAVDLLDTPTQYVLTAEVPGLNVEDIEVAFEEGELVLRGHKVNGAEEEEDVVYHRQERRFGSFCRRIALPEPVLEGRLSY